MLDAEHVDGAALRQAKELLSGVLFLPVERIGDQDDIGTLGEMDSLAFETLVFEIERALGHEVDAVRLLSMRSVGDLAALLAEARS